MAALGSASVVNIASDLAKQPEPALMAYGACKAALLHVTKNLAKDTAEDPRERRLARTGLDAAVVFLASPLAKFITGANLGTDLTAGLQ